MTKLIDEQAAQNAAKQKALLAYYRSHTQEATEAEIVDYIEKLKADTSEDGKARYLEFLRKRAELAGRL